MITVKLLKDYPIREDIVISKGSEITIGEYRAIQLAKRGFIKNVVADHKKVQDEQKASSGRQQKEEKPQEVIHKIEVDDNEQQ